MRTNPQTVGSIRALHQEGVKQSEIARRTNVNRHTVKKYVMRYQANGFQNLIPLHAQSSGRPNKLTADQINDMNRLMDEEPNLTARQMREKLNLFNVSVRTVSRKLAHLGYRYVRCARKLMLTPTNVDDRKQLHLNVEKEIRANPDYLNNIVFVDETLIRSSVSVNKSRYVRRKRGSNRLDPKYIYYREPHAQITIQAYGAIGINGKSRLVLKTKSKETRFNGDTYHTLLAYHLKDMLSDLNIPPEKAILAQDGCRFHRTAKNLRYLKSKKITLLDPWPGNSPCFNPIESCWSMLKKNLDKYDRSTEAKLRRSTLLAWDEITKVQAANCAKSFIGRLRKAAANDYGSTKH